MIAIASFGKPGKPAPARSTIQGKAVPWPPAPVDRGTHAAAPNRLWLSDLRRIPAWSRFASLTLVIEANDRRIAA